MHIFIIHTTLIIIPPFIIPSSISPNLKVLTFSCCDPHKTIDANIYIPDIDFYMLMSQTLPKQKRHSCLMLHGSSGFSSLLT